MVEPLRHRQTKGAATDMPGLLPPRHIPTLPPDPLAEVGALRLLLLNGRSPDRAPYHQGAKNPRFAATVMHVEVQAGK